MIFIILLWVEFVHQCTQNSALYDILCSSDSILLHILKAESNMKKNWGTAGFTQAGLCYMFQYSSCSSLALVRPRHMTIPILHRTRTSFFTLHCDQKAPQAISAHKSPYNYIYHLHFFSLPPVKTLWLSLPPPWFPPRPRSDCSLPTPSRPPSSPSRLNFIVASGLRGGESEF